MENKPVHTKKIVDAFMNAVDIETKYSLDELRKILSDAYKSSSKKVKSDVKREPSKYNIFVKNEIVRLKAENPDKNIKELMVIAACNWKESKNSSEKEGVCDTVME